MKTLLGWIVGVLGIGLFVGSFFGGTAAEKEAESVEAPLVECGPGTQAVIEPGTTPLRVRCMAIAKPPVTPVARAVAESRPAPAPAPSPAPAPAEEEVKSRSVKDSALIIGGAAGAGAGIGAIAKGKKGAALGAAIGGVAGAVYDIATRNPKR